MLRPSLSNKTLTVLLLVQWLKIGHLLYHQSWCIAKVSHILNLQ